MPSEVDIVTSVLEEPAASILMVSVDPEEGGGRFFRSVVNRAPFPHVAITSE
jgi:hypothetical protein